MRAVIEGINSAIVFWLQVICFSPRGIVQSRYNFCMIKFGHVMLKEVDYRPEQSFKVDT